MYLRKIYQSGVFLYSDTCHNETMINVIRQYRCILSYDMICELGFAQWFVIRDLDDGWQEIFKILGLKQQSFSSRVFPHSMRRDVPIKPFCCLNRGVGGVLVHRRPRKEEEKMFLTACRCCLYLLPQLYHLLTLSQLPSFNIIKPDERVRKLSVNI